MSDITSSKSAGELLLETKIQVASATYALISLTHRDWTHLLENPELSPRSDALFMIFRDAHEVTLLLEERTKIEFVMLPALRGLSVTFAC